jgi:hypothetical protein
MTSTAPDIEETGRVATRIPVRQAEALRALARAQGTTVSRLVAFYIASALRADLRRREAS